MMANESDVLIVGASPAGLVCANTLSSAGLNVQVLEMGSTAGSKTFYSGIVSSKLFSDLDEKIIERKITQRRAYVLSKDGKHTSDSTQKKNLNYSVLWTPFLDGLVAKIKKSKGKVSFGEVVRELLYENGKIVGVRTDKNIYKSKVVVISEGINSVLTKKHGYRKGVLTPDQLFLFAEENLALPSKIIDESLNLKNGEGLQAKLFTNFNSISGVAYLTTNKESVTLGIGVLLKDLIEKESNINDQIEALKSHATLKSIISGGNLMSYSSYSLPARFRGRKIPLPHVSSNGCLLIGGAATLVNPFSWSVSDLPVVTGQLAAEAILKANEKNDFSEESLSVYDELLSSNSYVKELGTLPVDETNELLLFSGRYLKVSKSSLMGSLSSYVAGKEENA